jgi:hypothetical protein
MTEEQELRTAFNEAKARIEEGQREVKRELELVREARKRMLAAVGIRTGDAQE